MKKADSGIVQKHEKNPSLFDKLNNSTGFILEHEVASKLEKQGWSVIHNRFYLDDVQPTQREIDLLAYKVDQVEDQTIYTTLIISCKKSVFKDWVFLTRKAIGTKPNIDLMPYTYWSNSELIQYEMYNFRELLDAKERKDLDKLFLYEKTVFGFREYDRKQNGDLKNDTGIFDSIISLLKAQSYELESLPERRKDSNCFYNFNLISVADVENFHEVTCVDDDSNETTINRINYINRFLINKREHYAKIDFIKYSAFNEVLIDYENLHKINVNLITKSINTFYKSSVLESYTAIRIIINKNKEELLSHLKWYLYDHIEISDQKFEYLGIFYNKKEERFEIDLDLDKETTKYLNSDSEVYEITGNWLNEYFRYDGKFEFTDSELPF